MISWVIWAMNVSQNTKKMKKASMSKNKMFIFELCSTSDDLLSNPSYKSCQKCENNGCQIIFCISGSFHCSDHLANHQRLNDVKVWILHQLCKGWLWHPRCVLLWGNYCEMVCKFFVGVLHSTGVIQTWWFDLGSWSPFILVLVAVTVLCYKVPFTSCNTSCNNF